MSKKIRHLLFFAFGFLLFTSSFSQVKRMLRFKAEEAVKIKDWHLAVQYYIKLQQRDSGSLKNKYNLAEVSRMDFDVDLAMQMYLRVNAFDKKNKYPLSLYWLGQLYMNKEKYIEAKKFFLRFIALKLIQPEFDYYNKRAQTEVEACDWAVAALKHPIKMKIDHISPTLNSKFSEYGPVEFDSTLYYSTMKMVEHKDEEPEVLNSKIYKSEIKNHKQQRPKLMDTTIDKPNIHNANITFSKDGNTIVFSRCVSLNHSDFRCSLHLSQLKNKKWQPDKTLPPSINQPSTTSSMPNLSILNGKEVLFFCSDRPGGEGGLDIWYSYKTDSVFSEPVNAGKNINTPEDDITPWFVPEENMLYYSTAYKKGFGGFDIFKSELKNNQFSESVNAGYPVNSGNNDVYFSTNNFHTRAYFSSNRTGTYFENKKLCNCNDIFDFRLDTAKPKVVAPPIPKKDTLTVAKEQLKLLCPLTLYFHNDEPEPKTTQTITKKNYETTYKEYKALLPTYNSEYSSGLRGDRKEFAQSEIEDFFADSVDAGFESLKKFTESLNRVLQKGETVKITMKGYCSSLASNDYNKNLAKRRINSLENYFKDYHGEMFYSYIHNTSPNGGKIIFEEVDIGELTGSKSSDNLNDKRNSVYNPQAASERKIQILAVNFEK